MSAKATYIVKHDNPSRAQVCERAIAEMRSRYARGEDFEMEIREPRRSIDSNAAMWASLTDFQRHVEWMVTDRHGKQVPATVEDVKDILTAAFEGETRMAMGLNGGIVILGARTSRYSKRKMGDFLTFIHAEGSERGVQWSDKALEDLAMWAPAERKAA